jgi:hypothetical protein
LSRSQKEWKNLRSTEAKTKTSEEEPKVNRNETEERLLQKKETEKIV